MMQSHKIVFLTLVSVLLWPNLHAADEQVRCSDEKNANGTHSCSRQLTSSMTYEWRHTAVLSNCSTDCGFGVEMVSAQCYSTATNQQVPDSNCDRAKPSPMSRRCKQLHCRVAWITDVWQSCTVTCGGGVEQRSVYCVRERDDGTFQAAVSDDLCSGTKPASLRRCNEQPCPAWFTGVWSPCVATCGSTVGFQVRAVACSSGGVCSKSNKPMVHRSCLVDDPLAACADGVDSMTTELASGPHKLQFEAARPAMEPLLLQADEPRTADDKEAVSSLRAGREKTNMEISTIPSFMTSPWGPCSATCGVSVRSRSVQCRAFVEETMSVQDLPDSSCTGAKPDETEYCIQPECSLSLAQESYSWSFSGYGPCSKSCAGGTQDPVFSCMRLPDFVTVKSDRCSRVAPPPVEHRSCNPQRCPPKWRSFPYGACSAPCGGGQQIRHVQCVVDAPESPATDDTDLSLSFFDDVVVVPDERCNASTSPPRTSLCNLAPCPPAWSVDSWSECSVSCGRGIQHRQVRCEQKITAFTIATVPDAHCVAAAAELSGGSATKPATEQQCHLSDCPARRKSRSRRRRSAIVGEPTEFVLMSPRDRVTLEVGGGVATVVPDTTVRIFCPVSRRFRGQEVVWRRTVGSADDEDGDVIGKRGRVKVTGSGVLRIRKSRPSDAGVYWCVVGVDRANLTLKFHSLEDALALAHRRRQLAAAGHHDQRPNDGDPLRPPSDPRQARRRLRRSSAATGVPLAYVPGQWSACTRACGGAGLQSRRVACEVRGMPDYRLAVIERHCAHRELVKPNDMQDCGYVMCPMWEAGPWSECTAEHCAAVGVGERRRETLCVAFNGSLLDAGQCDPDTRPDSVDGCQHDACVTMWTTSGWSKCSLSCGGRGVKTRDVQCVWMSNMQQTSVEHCAVLPMPPDSKPCYTSPCMDSGCRDESKYCNLIPALHMCRYPQYRHRCCQSCSRHAIAPAPFRSAHRYVV